MVKLKLPKGMTSVSFAGIEYPAVKGAVSVPAESIPDLLSLGFVCEDTAAPEAPITSPESAL